MNISTRNKEGSQLNGSAANRICVGFTLALIWAYISAVFLVDEPDLPLNFGFLLWFFLIGVAALAGYFLADWVLRWQVFSVQQLAGLCLLGVISIICLVALDIVYSMYMNSTVSTAVSVDSRRFDKNVWISELYPKLYYPNERNFRLHKPDVMVSGNTFGYFYREPMQKSPTLVRSVLEKYPITIRINDMGFREHIQISDTDIFALGDSFTFGWGVNESERWTGLLGRGLHRPVYNLGIHDSSPRQELELLKFVLKEQGENIRIRQLLWMIYEGNDLEDDYSKAHQRNENSARPNLADDTLIGMATTLPRIIKHQSVINKLRSGEVIWKTSLDNRASAPYLVDGVALAQPLFYSEQLGPRLFLREYVERAGAPSSYVWDHPNRSLLEVVFHEMKALADEHGFDVAVIIAPTASRLHGPSFENFPKISATPHFINFVASLSASAGFVTVDLYDLMQPYANNELLFFRDDDHFNHRGNKVVAELIQREVFTGQE